MSRSIESLKRTAYHEAGHAVAAFVVGRPIGKLSIVEDEDSLGRMESYGRVITDSDAHGPMTCRLRMRIEDGVITLLAGLEAERRFSNKTRARGSAYDYLEAAKGASLVCTSSKETNAYLAWLRIRARQLVASPGYWFIISTLAEILVERREIGARTVRILIKKTYQRAAESRVR